MGKLLLGLLLLLLMPGPPVESVAPRLLISELLPDPHGRDIDYEWWEIANVGNAPADLSDYRTGDAEQAGAAEGMVRFPQGTLLPPGAALIIARSGAAFTARYGFAPDFALDGGGGGIQLAPDRLWGLGETALGNAGDALLLMDPTYAPVDGVSYGSATGQLLPPPPAPPPGASLARTPAYCDSDTAAEWHADELPTPGLLPDGTGICPPPPPVAGAQPIGAIQGPGAASPHVGERVVVVGVVTGLLADHNAAGTLFYGFVLQNRPAEADGDPRTADGLLIFTGRSRWPVAVGDALGVSGVVTEYFGQTELATDVTLVARLGSGTLPAPVPLVAPLPADLEAFEGMRVRVAEATIAGPLHDACGLAIIPALAAPEDVALLRRLPGNLLVVEFERDRNCPPALAAPAGSLLSALVGPLVFQFDQFRLLLAEENLPYVSPPPLRIPPAAPRPPAGGFSVATLNVENLFDALPDSGHEGEPRLPEWEQARRLAKLAALLGDLAGCPTLVGVQEVEKASLLQGLALAATARCGFTYDVVHRESPDVRGIDVALLVDPRRVTVESARLAQRCSPLATGIVDPAAGCSAGMAPLFSRPPLLVRLRLDGEPLLLMVNHFKSKRGGAQETAPRRLAQARHVVALVAAAPQRLALVVGDFNDGEDTATQRVLLESGRLRSTLAGLADETRYSYVFSGWPELLDGIFVSPVLYDRLLNAMILHAAADFPAAWQRLDDAARLPLRATDHDLPLALFGPPPVPVEPAATAAPRENAPTLRVAGQAMVPDWRRMWIGVGLLLVVISVGWLGRRRRR